MRKVTLELKVKMVVTVDEGVEIGEVVDELDYSFAPSSHATVEDTEILDYEVKDSK